MKILVVGNYKWDFYEDALCYGFEKNHIETLRYKIDLRSMWDKIKNRADLLRANKEFLKYVSTHLPNVIFLYRVNDILGSTLSSLKKEMPHLKILTYHNDNPYHGLKNNFKYSLFFKSILLSDIHYVYRPSNLIDSKKRGVERAEVLMPYFDSRRIDSRCFDLKEKSTDVVFIGHYEPNRLEAIQELINNKVKIKIFGPNWGMHAKHNNWPDNIVKEPVYGKQYMAEIAKSKLALCFLSKINKDVYTRRNIEIPAAGTLVLSEYTPELSTMFEEDKEILLFKNTDELVEKTQWALKNESVLTSLTNMGQLKVLNGGFSEVDCASRIIDDIKGLA